MKVIYQRLVSLHHGLYFSNASFNWLNL